MKPSLESRLERLESLYSEQDYTIQSLNDIVSRQELEILRLNQTLVKIDSQLKALKSELPGIIDPVVDKPPHY